MPCVVVGRTAAERYMQFRVQFGAGAGDPPVWLRGPARILTALAGVVVFVGFFLFFTVFVAVAAVFVMVLAVRWWWANRKLRKRAEQRADQGVIDAEYRVVEAEVIEARRESD